MPVARALGHVIIKNLVRTGISQSAIARAVRQAGYGYRTKDLLSDIRRFSGRFLNEFYIRKLGPGGTIAPNLMQDAVLKRPFTYQVFGESTLWDPATDSYTFKKSSFYTDRLLTNEGWEDEFIEKQRAKYQLDNLETVGFTVSGAEHNTGYEYL